MAWIVALLCFLAAPRVLAEGRTLAVLGYLPIGKLDRALVRALTESQRSAAEAEARGKGLRVISFGEMLTLAKRNPAWRVDSGYDELALGRLAGVDLVLAGQLIADDLGFQVTVRLYDVAGESELSHAELRIAKEGALAEAAGQQTRSLLHAALRARSAPPAGKSGRFRFVGTIAPQGEASKRARRSSPATPLEDTLPGAEACASLFSGAWVCDATKAAPALDAELLRACEDGKAESCYRLGLFGEECSRRTPGKDCPDPKKARELFRTAARQFTELCKQGDAPSCRDLGVMTLNFQDEGNVNDNVARAAALFDEACSRGDAWGCCQLADLYLSGGRRSGLGERADQTRAAKLYRLACDKHDQTSCSNLARMLHQGIGVEVDRPRARSLLLAACEAGHLATCAQLGTLYDTACGVKADLPRAAALYGKACTAGDQASCRNLDKVRKKIPRRR